jgi:hypothetical protein
LSILLAADSKTRNLCLDPLDDDVTSLVLCSCHDASLHGEGKANVSIIDPNDLVDCTFLLPQQEDGQWFQAHIVKALNDYDSDLGTQPDHIRFLCLAKDGDFEEILSYSELMDSLESQEDGEGNIWKFCWITGILHLINKTSLDWYFKKQATVETATYGSEFVAACTCVDQIVDLHTTLHYLGVPL